MNWHLELNEDAVKMLMADRERLDYLQNRCAELEPHPNGDEMIWCVTDGCGFWHKHTDLRKAIDLAMLEDQPHTSDCAAHRAPAYPAGDCDCGAKAAAPAPAAGQAEPVAWADPKDLARKGHDLWVAAERVDRYTQPLYTAPQPAVRESRDALANQPETSSSPDAQIAAHAKRLALELECLLLDANHPAVSRWWDSAHEALDQYRADIDRLYPQDHVSPLGKSRPDRA